MALHAAATPRCSSPDGPGGTASTKSLHSCSTPSHSEFPSANASASALNPSKHVLIFTGDSGGVSGVTTKHCEALEAPITPQDQ